MAEGGSKLSEEQIYECLKSLNVQVKMNDLKVPSREFVVRVFESFIKDLQIDITGHELRTWEATNHLEEGEIYEEPMCLILLAMTLNHITNPCGLNITIKDIVEPKPKRTKKILNYLLVFWNYYLRKCARFHAIEAMYEEEKEKAEALIDENNSLDEKYNDMLNILKSMKPCKEELSDIVAAKDEKIAKLQTDCATVSTDYQCLKTKEDDLRNKISAIDVQILTGKQRLEELGQLILSSPERMDNEIQKLRERIKGEDLKIKEFENRCRDAEKKLQLLEEYKREDEKGLKAVNDLNEEINRAKETVKDIISVHQKINDEEDKVKRLNMDVIRKEESVTQQEQTSAKIALNCRKQIETLQEVLKINLNAETNERNNIEFIKAAINEMQKRIDSETDLVLEVVSKSKEADAKSKTKKTQYECKLIEASTAFKSDCAEIQEVFKKAFSYELEKD